MVSVGLEIQRPRGSNPVRSTIKICESFPRVKVRRYPVKKTYLYLSSALCFRFSRPPAVSPALLRHVDMGSLTCAHVWVRAVHTKRGEGRGSATNKSAQELTRRDRKTIFHPGPSGNQTQGFGYYHSDALTTELRLPPPLLTESSGVSHFNISLIVERAGWGGGGAKS